MARVDVRVAASGLPFPDVHVPWRRSDADWDVGYDHRPQTIVSVEETTTLYEVLAAASEQLGVRDARADEVPSELAEWVDDVPAGPARWLMLVDFYRPGDRYEMRRTPWGAELPAVDAAGRLYRDDWRGLPMADLIRAADEGLFPGDPLRPYLVVHPPQGGDLWTQDWEALRATLEALWVAADWAARVGGAVGFLEIVRRRISRSREAVAANAENWKERGLDPQATRDLLATRERWRTEQVAVLLDCPEAQVEGVMPALGWRWDREWTSWVPGPALLQEATRAMAEQPLPGDLAEGSPARTAARGRSLLRRAVLRRLTEPLGRPFRELRRRWTLRGRARLAERERSSE